MWIQRRTILDTTPMLVAIFVVFFTSVQCQRIASTQPERVTGKEGDQVDLLCTFGQRVDRCTFVLPNNEFIKLDPRWNSKYRYFGTGLENGQCGMSIDVLTPELEGNITCRLDLGDGTDDIIGVIPIEIARPPSKIELIVQNQRNLEAGQELNAECAYRDGSPSARVSWYLGGEAIQSKEQFDHQDRDTIVSFVQHRLSDSDNLKMLVCRLDHPALPSGYTNTSEQLIVNFQPLALSRDELVVSGLEIGQTADVIVRIRANPKPRLQWTIDGTTYEEGRQTAKYIVNQAEQDEEGRWIAKLTIVDLSLQDTLRTYNLRANNNFGSNDYAVRIGGAQELDDSGLGIIPIIGITIISIFVLIVVALLVVARITKRWCFAGDSLHPNSPDSEAQIAPDEDKTHEQYEQHESKVTDDESGDVEHKSNGKSNGNTSV